MHNTFILRNFYILSILLLILSPIFLFRLNDIQFGIHAYFLLIIFGIVSFNFKKILSFNKRNILIIILIYFLFTIYTQDIRSFFLFIPFLIFYFSLKYKLNTFVNIILILSSFFLIHVLLQIFFDFDFLYYLNINSYLTNLPKIRPSSIYPFQVYLNQVFILFSIVIILSEHKLSKIFFFIFVFYSGLSGSMALIIFSFL